MPAAKRYIWRWLRCCWRGPYMGFGPPPRLLHTYFVASPGCLNTTSGCPTKIDCASSAVVSVNGKRRHTGRSHPVRLRRCTNKNLTATNPTSDSFTMLLKLLQSQWSEKHVREIALAPERPAMAFPVYDISKPTGLSRAAVGRGC